MTVRGGVDVGATLVGHSSYEYGPPESAPAGFARQSVSAGVVPLAQKHIDEEMAVRGYQQHPNADMIVRLSSGRRIVDERVPAPSTIDNGDPEYIETDGALVVDIFDAQSHRRLYHAMARDAVTADKIDDDQIKEAVHRLLAAVPAASRP